MQALQDEGITCIITIPLMLQKLRERILSEVSAQDKNISFSACSTWQLNWRLAKLKIVARHMDF